MVKVTTTDSSYTWPSVSTDRKATKWMADKPAHNQSQQLLRRKALHKCFTQHWRLTVLRQPCESGMHSHPPNCSDTTLLTECNTSQLTIDNGHKYKRTHDDSNKTPLGHYCKPS
jgi:predicted nucleic acid-binding Zn ribbon protein